MTSNDYRPIACGLHDHVELACLRGYRVRVATGEGIASGRALTTETDADKTEWLVLEADGIRQRVRLDRILGLEPLDADATFGMIRFDPP